MKRFIAIKKRGTDKLFLFREGKEMLLLETRTGQLNLHGVRHPQGNPASGRPPHQARRMGADSAARHRSLVCK